ncbi:chain-length determining protein [Arthrobacter sp. SIMBA_036]|uniref:chain-length determining protein n=2 Tax=Bacillati TaxID=1783272 RepID=UPI00397D0153
MDPLAVIKALWHHKFVVIPALLLTAFAAVYVYAFAPRSYQAQATYAIVNPKVPTASELERNPSLQDLNSDNPYLRASDSSLIAQVEATRLKADSVGSALSKQSLSTDYTVERSPNSFLLDISAVSPKKEVATATVQALGAKMQQDLKQIQTVNGAADRFLFTTVVVTPPDNAIEQFSSRLRSLIVVIVGGLVLTFGAVSAARALETARMKSAGAGATPGDAAAKRGRRHASHGEAAPSHKDAVEIPLEKLGSIPMGVLQKPRKVSEMLPVALDPQEDAPTTESNGKGHPGIKSPVGRT